MQNTLPGRTLRETRLSADGGRTAAIAIGQQCLARHLYACAEEDMAILGLSEIPEPRPQKWPVTGGSDEDRKARVDAWAARHGVKAHPDDESGTYEAVLSFGPFVRVVVYMIPDRVMAERVEALHRAVAEREVAA